MRSNLSLRLSGAITPLVTPFRHGALDIKALEMLAEWQIASGIGALAVGTVTGEGPALSQAERETALSTVLRVADDRIPVLAATGTNCTAQTIEATQRAEALGASAALVTVPYYSKPGQKGILHHFGELAAATNLPLIIVNDPARTASLLLPSTLDVLSADGTIFGLLDIEGDMATLACYRDRLHLFTGNALGAPAFLACGGDGVIAPVGNVLPKLVTSLQHAAACGNLPAALTLADRMTALIDAIGDDPACIKYALSAYPGICADVRPPLVAADDAAREAVAAALMPFAATPKRALSL